MDEQNNLVKLDLDEIERSRQELGNMPEEANRLIHFLNTHTKNQLAEIGIQDRTGTILEIKKVFTKRNLLQNFRAKVLRYARRNHCLQRKIEYFVK